MSTHDPAPHYTPKKLTPVVTVDDIEPLLPFWRDRLGFEVTAEVPHDDRIGFVILVRGGAEVMLQTFASVQADDARVAEVMAPGNPVLFMEVDSIEAVERALKGVELLVPRRETFYGSTEVWVQAPDGTVLGFAQFGGKAEEA
jgi:catechol 2,3-dioxygenase-like lactoylglutathione lyase family enzyme